MVIEMEAELDMPPAGTPCITCKSKGHFCQADVYAAGDSGNGVCEACLEGRDCDVVKARLGVGTPDPLSVPRVSKEQREANRRELIADPLRRGKTVRQIGSDEGFSEQLILEVRSTIPADELPKKTGPKIGSHFHIAKAMKSDSPVEQDKRQTYRISDEVRQQIIAESPSIPSSVLGKKYGCSAASVDNFRKAAGTFIPSKTRGPAKKELAVTTPVTIVTVPAQEPKLDMTLSRAFELVMAELRKGLDHLVEIDDDDPDLKKSIEAQKGMIGMLHDSHPAFMGFSETGRKESLYQRALDRAIDELHIIELELQRLEKRRDALKPMMKVLKENIEAERDTR